MGDKRAAVDLDTIDALTAPTTSATWEYTPGIAHKHYVGSTDGDLHIGLQMMHPDDGRSVPAEANARFIAASRTNIPAMSAALREQDEEIAKLNAEVARLKAFVMQIPTGDNPIHRFYCEAEERLADIVAIERETKRAETPMIPDFKSALRPAVPTGVERELLTGCVNRSTLMRRPDPIFERTSRGEYLRDVRRALDIHMENGAKILKIGIADFSGLEMGRLVFIDASTWARVELALISAVAPGWCGENASMRIDSAACGVNALANRRKGPPEPFDFGEAAEDLEAAAFKQIHTVKRGILYRLAGALALEAGEYGEAVKFALVGLDVTGSIGPMPPWLAAGLQAVLVAARAEPVGA